jgi:dUTP pyrophosphatase
MWHLPPLRTNRLVTASLTDTTTATTLVVELLFPDAQQPERATPGSAGYDLRAYVRGRSIKCSDGSRVWDISSESRQKTDQFAIPTGVCALIPLGFKARMPVGIEGQVRPRSGTSFKKGLQIPNAPGTIDSDFPDEWMVLVRNPLDHEVVVEHGERIAQLVFSRYEVLAIEHGAVAVTTTRVGGFGSTGA